MSYKSQFQQFLDELEAKIGDLPFANQIAFGAACCERSFPNYVSFCKEAAWGDPESLRLGLNRAWSLALGEPMAASECVALRKGCESATPSSEDFPNVDATAAQEAAFMVTLLVIWCCDPNPNYAVRISTFARDTLDLTIQASENLSATDPELEIKIANHSLMIRELRKQQSDLDRLIRAKTSDDLKEFCRRSKLPD